MTHPEQSSEQNHDRGYSNDSPRDRRVWISEIFGARPDVFGARELQLRDFFFGDLDARWRLVRLRTRRGLRLCRRPRSWRTRIGCRAAYDPGWLWLANFVRLNLGLAQATEIVGDCIFVVEAEVLGVGPNESFIEDAARQLIEVFFFDGLQHARTDLGDARDVIEGKIFRLARFAEFVAEVAHRIRVTKTS